MDLEWGQSMRNSDCKITSPRKLQAPGVQYFIPITAFNTDPAIPGPMLVEAD
jgi:hypothetical protein